MPAPLTPADCNLRGFPWMALDTVRLIDSDLFLLSTGDEFKAALALWCKSWSQVPAGSLPNDERLLGKLSGASNWKKVRDMALRGWVLCDDGRLYHQVVAEKALEALPAMKAHAEHKAASKDRKARERADRARLFELLREHGIVPEYDTKTVKLREMAAPYLQPVTPHVTPPVTRDTSQHVTANTGQDSTEQNSTEQSINTSVPNGTGGAAAEPDLLAACSVLQADGRDLTDDEEKLIWNASLALLMPSYAEATGGAKQREAKARSFVGGLGKRIKEAGAARRVLFDVIQAACIERPINPETWMSAAVATRCGTRAAPNKQESIEAGNLAAASRFAEGANA